MAAIWAGRVRPGSGWSALSTQATLGQIKLKALDDPDLEPLWAEIGEI